MSTDRSLLRPLRLCHLGSARIIGAVGPADLSPPPPDPAVRSERTASSEPPGPRYTVAAVARRLGLAPATLRTWDRRYGLGPSGHAFGQHRRYTEADVERLMLMRRLTLSGVPPSEAALLRGSGTAEPAAAQSGGGRVIALPGGAPDVRGLARAAMSLDAAVVTATVSRSIHSLGVAATWHGLVAPVLNGIAERWEATGEGVDVEHLLAESTLSALRLAPTHALDGPPRCLLACAPEDYHALPLHVLAAALAEQGIATRNLGAAVPQRALAAAVRRVGPAVVFLWSSLPSTGDPAQLASVPTTAPAASILLGGAGWWLEDLPPRAELIRDVPQAVQLVAQRLGR